MTGNRERADVTVAVSTVDRPTSLGRCVTAILSGRVLPSEVVIVDQSADSATADLVRPSLDRAPVPIRYVRQPRRGLAASRNLAAEHATRSVIAFTDDDCVPDPEWVGSVAAAFQASDRPHAVTGRVLPLGPERAGRYAVSSRTSVIRRLYCGRVLPWDVGSGANTAIDRERLRQIGGFDETLGAGSRGQAAEDTDVLYRLLLDGARVLYEPAAIVYHERQDRARRLSSRRSYGFGMGAFCAKWARRGHLHAGWMLSRWTAQRVRSLLGATVRRRPMRIREELLMLGWAARGLAHGLAFAPRERECPYDLSHGSSSSI